jgi:hypothetical protein
MEPAMNDVSRIRPARFPADHVSRPTPRRDGDEAEEGPEPDGERRGDRVELETKAEGEIPAPRRGEDDDEDEDESSEEGSRIDVVA